MIISAEWLDTLTDTIAFTGGFRVLIAAVLGVVLGLERQFSGKDAGPRTYALVASGSALFTVLSIEAFAGADTARVAAQNVTGIGFLGAGIIFRQGANVSGLTTAAGLWSVAAIGMAVGAGFWGLAIVAAAIVLAVLKISDRFSTQLRSQALRGAQSSVRLTCRIRPRSRRYATSSRGSHRPLHGPFPTSGTGRSGRRISKIRIENTD